MYVTIRCDRRHSPTGVDEHVDILTPDTPLGPAARHDVGIERVPLGGRRRIGVMAEKQISPKAPENAQSQSPKTAAARVSKKKMARKKMARKRMGGHG
jgi:hypothetical protein